MLAAPWSVIHRAADQGLALGAHSMTHRALSTLAERDIQFEVTPCRGVIAQRTGYRPSIFSYPYGSFDERVIKAVQAAGYSAAVALDAGLNDAHTDPFALRRISVPASLPAERFDAWTAGLVPHHRRSA
jgi:peptidoglycan/xylan/chitin deacetylase (PgdA/CDA1 family)